MVKKFFIVLFAGLFFYSCDDKVLTDEQECIKTVMDTYENADNYTHISLSEYSAADIPLDSFKNTGTVRIYVEAVCFALRDVEQYKYNIEHGIPCHVERTCEEVLEDCLAKLELEQETVDRKLSTYTERNYVIVHDFLRYGLHYRQRYFLNAKFEIIARDYLIGMGVDIPWTPIMCE